MRALALDLASCTGYCIGMAGDTPRVGTWRLRKRGQTSEDAARSLGCLLRDLFVLDLPGIIFAEDFMSLAAQLSADSGEMALRLHGALDAVAGAYGIPVRRTSAATIRVHFIGKATVHPPRKRGEPQRTARQKAQMREDTKRAVWRRAVQLGYLERGVAENFDVSDSIAVWDHGTSTFCKVQRPFALFGGNV